MIITLSRQTGSGARVVGAQLGRKLGIRVLGADIRRLVAQRLQTSEEMVAALDERLEPAGVRIMRSLGASVAPEIGVASAVELEVTADDVERATRETIRDLASRESLVIVGRGARWILGDRPETLHVRLVAPLDVRVARYMEEVGAPRSAARSVVQAGDRARAAHVQRYFRVDWNDPENYHLVLNTGLLSLAAATDLIVAAARHVTSGPDRETPEAGGR
ncbi:MAG: cytidylate kinase-like family protein [Chloroflexi bacterium]|nr:cytidylate kinase-like family protein [Chloroflexota bacterium]